MTVKPVLYAANVSDSELAQSPLSLGGTSLSSGLPTFPDSILCRERDGGRIESYRHALTMGLSESPQADWTIES